jgi:putative restriction endonuclease
LPENPDTNSTFVLACCTTRGSYRIFFGINDQSLSILFFFGLLTLKRRLYIGLLMEGLLQQITSLRRSTTKFGPAPHKPILLLALIESFEEGEIDGNFIAIHPRLLTRFYDLWHLLVFTANAPNFSLAFFNMGNERRELWNLIEMPGMGLIRVHKFYYNSIKRLKETFVGAKLSDEFFSALKDRQSREVLEIALLDTYFPECSLRKKLTAKRYSSKIENQILYAHAKNYQKDIILSDREETFESREEELVLRNFIFNKMVIDFYDRQCAITGLKIESHSEEFLIDACAIVPLRQINDYSIANGIALSPTLHRAFDSGLIAIDNNYKILVPRKLNNFDSKSGIRHYANKTILLPCKEEFYPSLERLAEHRIRFGYE